MISATNLVNNSDKYPGHAHALAWSGSLLPLHAKAWELRDDPSCGVG
ncbi:MAG: hypothetical protein LCH67_10460 [Bacteroidetes bacterium]|nr:hypothetical protein [Bacteroidota bacterium]